MTKERCKHYLINLEDLSELSMSEILPICESKIPTEAKHGDIVYTEKFLQSLDVFFVDCTFDENGKVIEKCLRQHDLEDTGCCSVPIEVTCKIADPIKFYENSFKFSDYDEKDFMGIEIDTEIHQKLIQFYTDGKAIHKSRKCMYFHVQNQWADTPGMYVWCEKSGKYLKLTTNVAQELLNEEL